MTGPRPDYQDLLRRVSYASSKGAALADLDAYIRRESGGALNSIHDLTAAATQKPEQSQGWGDAYKRAGTLLANGATLGGLSKVAGLGAAIIPGGQNYTEARDAVQAKVDEARQQSGLLGTGLELAGGVAPAMLAGPLGLATGGPMTLAQRVGQGLGAGGVFGTAAGALSSQGQSAGDVAGDALKGGAAGAVVGVALPVLTTVAKKLGTKASHIVQMLTSKDVAAKRVGYTNAIKAFQNLGMTPEEALAETRKLSRLGGADVVAADLDPNLAAEARRSLSNAPGTSTRILDQMETRGAGRGARLAGTAEEAMGITRSGVEEAKGAAISAMRKLGKRLYDPFRAKPIEAPDQTRLEEFFRDPKMDALDPNIAKAIRGMWQEPAQASNLPWPPPPGLKRPDLEKMGYSFAGGLPARPEPTTPYTFGKLQDIRRRMMGVRNLAMQQDPNFSGPAWSEKIQDLTQIMEDIFPGYHSANAQMRRAAVSSPPAGHGMEWDFTTKGGGNKASVKVQDAWLEGADALGKSAPEVQRTMSALLEVGGPEAADAFRAGWLEALTTDLRSASQTGNLGERLVAMGDDIADVHKLMFPRPQDYNRMMGRARAERAMRRTEAAIGGARSTVDRNEAFREAQAGAEAIGGMVTKSPWAAVRLMRMAGRGETEAIQGQANKHLLKFLTSPPSPENQAMWDELQRMFQAQARLPQGPGIGPAMGGQVAGQMMGRP